SVSTRSLPSQTDLPLGRYGGWNVIGTSSTMSAQLVRHHLRPRFAWPAPLCSALGLRPRLMWPLPSCHLYSWASLDGSFPWSDGLPPSPSSSSCRWFPHQGRTRRLGRTGTRRDR